MPAPRAIDQLAGRRGNDYLRGGEGNDHLVAGAGYDLLIGSQGRDALSGSSGNDVLEGGAGADVVRGEDGDDREVREVREGSERAEFECFIGRQVFPPTSAMRPIRGKTAPPMRSPGAPEATRSSRRAGAGDAVSCGGGPRHVLRTDRVDRVASDCLAGQASAPKGRTVQVTATRSPAARGTLAVSSRYGRVTGVSGPAHRRVYGLRFSRRGLHAVKISFRGREGWASGTRSIRVRVGRGV